ncbi:MAG: hypothetical protein M3413_00170 [Bacteroidota bacterium]|jgi:hypothetical protein|nr:hypothetical protein [Bacteroidota bacterium]
MTSFFKMHKHLLLLITSIYVVLSCNAQITLEPTESLKGEAIGFVFYGTDGLSKTIPYSRIKGSPFWKDEWKLASLYTGNRLLYVMPVKLNLATSEIHYLKNDEIKVLTGVNVTILAFHADKDTTVTTDVFLRHVPNLRFNNKEIDNYIKVLNSGQFQLLKYTYRKVDSADSLFRTQKRYFFINEDYYFLRNNDRIERIKKLNKESVLEFLPSALSFSPWIAENKIDLRKEEDVIRFLTHYNSSRQNKED